MRTNAHSTKIGRNDNCPCNIHLSWVNDAVKVEIGDGKKYKKCCGSTTPGVQPKFPASTADFAVGEELVRQHNEELKARLTPEQWTKVTTPPASKPKARMPLFVGAALAAGICNPNLFPTFRP